MRNNSRSVCKPVNSCNAIFMVAHGITGCNQIFVAKLLKVFPNAGMDVDGSQIIRFLCKKNAL